VDAKAKVADLDKQKAAVRRELDSLRESERYLADLDSLAEELMRDLPLILERTPPLRDYETVPPEREPQADGKLPIYRLTPDRIRHLSEEELAEKRHAAEEERRARYRAVYEDLRLSVTAHRDGTLELRWAGGESALEPQVLQERSVSKRT
jgi:hypothetical protein